MKTNLHKIMEALETKSPEELQNELHEWFVDQAKKAHATLTGELVAEGEEADEEEAEELDEAEESEEEELEEAEEEELEEDDDRLDELSTDTMRRYAKAARKDRDRNTSDDEKVGRRVAGLDMVAQKTRREKAAPQYEDRVDELSVDTMKSYAKAARKDRDRPSADDEKVGRRVAGLDMVANKARREKAAPQYESADEEQIEEAKVPVDDAAAEKNAADGSNTPGEVDESYDALVAELNEAFKGLETVTDKLQNVEGAQVGEQGKVPVNTKGTLPSHKGSERVAGEPVEIKSNGHKGHALEKAPKVKDAPVKGTIQNDKDDPKKVADKGDASALLNKVDGSINTQSPISGKGAKGLKK